MTETSTKKYNLSERLKDKIDRTYSLNPSRIMGIGLESRSYQTNALSSLYDFFKNIKSSENGENPIGYVTMPPGSGKTAVFAKMLGSLGLRGIVISPTKVICEQNAEEIEKLTGINTKIYHSDLKTSDGEIMSTTYHSFLKFMEKGEITPGVADIIIFDEAHRALSDRRKAMVEKLPVPSIGFTATPHFSGYKSVQNLFKNNIYKMSYNEAIFCGALSPIEVRVLKTGVKVKDKIFFKGDLDEEKAEKLLNVEYRNKQVVELYKKEFSKIPTVAYCLNINHCNDLTELFRKKGIEAKSIHSKIHPMERRKILKDFEEGKIDVLCSRDVLLEGWNSNKVNVEFNLRPTYSRVIAEQRAGRVLRPNPQKKKGIIIELLDDFKRTEVPILATHIFRDLLIESKPEYWHNSKNKLYNKKDKGFISIDNLLELDVETKKQILEVNNYSADFRNKEILKEVLISRPDINYKEISLEDFYKENFKSNILNGKGLELLVNHFGKIPSNEEFKNLMSEMLSYSDVRRNLECYKQQKSNALVTLSDLLSDSDIELAFFNPTMKKLNLFNWKIQRLSADKKLDLLETIAGTKGTSFLDFSLGYFNGMEFGKEGCKLTGSQLYKNLSSHLSKSEFFRTVKDITSYKINKKLNGIKSMEVFDNDLEKEDMPFGKFSRYYHSSLNKETKDPADLFEEIELKEKLREGIDKLEEKEAKIIKYRYGIGDGKNIFSRTLREIGKKMKLSSSRVGQLEERAIMRLRIVSSNMGLICYVVD